MNELLHKSPSNIMNNSKINFSERSKIIQKPLINSNNLSVAKSSTNKTQKLLNNSSINNSSSAIQRSVKKPIIEYNGVGDYPVESEKNTLYSTWTPLSDDSTNNKVILKLNLY